MRRMLFLLVCACLSLVSMPAAEAGNPPPPASAAARRLAAPPSAPRALVAQRVGNRGLPGRAMRVSWKPPASAGSSKVRAYALRLEPGRGRRHSGRVVVPATKTHQTFRHLKPGRTYRVEVRAVNKAGRSRAVSVRYRVPKWSPSWVFAVNTAQNSIVRVPVSGGPVRTVTPNKTAWAVNAAGDVYVADREAKTVTRTPAHGSAARSIGSGFADPTDIQLDAAGHVYVVDGSRVVRMSATGKGQTVVAKPVSPAVFVRADGTVSTTAGDGQDSPLQIVTYPPGGGPVVTRTLAGQGEWGPYYPYRGNLIGDGAGNLFLQWISTGGSGFEWWFRVPAGSYTPTPLYTRWAYYAVVVDPKSRFYLAQTATFCDSVPREPDPCVPDETVDEILRYAPDGTSTSIKIEPFTYDRVHSNPVSTLAADRKGRLFVAQSVGPSAGLLKYGPKGGAVTVLASGAFTEPKRNN